MIMRLVLILLATPGLLATYLYQPGARGVLLRQALLERQLAQEVQRRYETERILASAILGQPSASAISKLTEDGGINCNTSPWYLSASGRVLRCDETKSVTPSLAPAHEKDDIPVRALLPESPSIGLTSTDNARLSDLTTEPIHGDKEPLLMTDVHETQEKHSGDVGPDYFEHHQLVQPILKPLKVKPFFHLIPIKPLVIPFPKPLLKKPLVYQPLGIQPSVHSAVLESTIVKNLKPIIKAHERPTLHATLLTFKKPDHWGIASGQLQQVSTTDKLGALHHPTTALLYGDLKQQIGQVDDKQGLLFSHVTSDLPSLNTDLPFNRQNGLPAIPVKEVQPEVGDVHEYGDVAEETKTVNELATFDSVPASSEVKPVHEGSEKAVPGSSELKPVHKGSEKAVPGNSEQKPVQKGVEKAVTGNLEQKPVHEGSEKAVPENSQQKPVQKEVEKSVPGNLEQKPVQEEVEKAVPGNSELEPIQEEVEKAVPNNMEVEPIKQGVEKPEPGNLELQPVQEEVEKAVPGHLELEPSEEEAWKAVPGDLELEPIQEEAGKAVPGNLELEPIQEEVEKAVPEHLELNPNQKDVDKAVPEDSDLEPIQEANEKTALPSQQTVVSHLQGTTISATAPLPDESEVRTTQPFEVEEVEQFVGERQSPPQQYDDLSSPEQPKLDSGTPESEQTTIDQQVIESGRFDDPDHQRNFESEKLDDAYQTESPHPQEIHSSTDPSMDTGEPDARGDVSLDSHYDERVALEDGPDVIEDTQLDPEEGDHLRKKRDVPSIPLDILQEHPRSATILDGSALIDIMAALKEQYLKNAEPDQRKLIEDAFDRLRCSVRDMKKLDERPVGKKVDGPKKAALELLAERDEPLAEESDYYSDATDDVSSEPSFLELLNVATKHKVKQSEDLD